MTGFAAFTVSVIIWASQGNPHIAEHLPQQQISPVFATINACRDDLKQNLNARFASAAQQAVRAMKNSPHYATDRLVLVRALERCLNTPVSADVKDVLSDE